MKSKLALAALLAATLALAACGNGGAAAKVDYGRAGMMAVYGEHAIAYGVHTNTLTVRELIPYHTGMGNTDINASFYVAKAGLFRVMAASGKVRVVVAAINDPTASEPVGNGADATTSGTPLKPGWYNTLITCESGRCTDVTAYLDGKPIRPYSGIGGYPVQIIDPLKDPPN